MAYDDKGMNVTHISSALNNYEAARSAFFTLIVNDLTNLIKPDYSGDPANAKSSDMIQNGQEILRLNVTKFPGSALHFDLKTEEYRRGNDVVKFATTPSWEGGEITVDDIVGIDTKSALMAWQYLAYNPHTRKGGRMKDYKKTCTLCEYTQDYELIRTWTLEGVFITKISEDDFDRENDGRRKLQVTFTFDRALVDLPNQE